MYSVGAVAAYLAVRGRYPGPFFRLVSGVPLIRKAFVSRMRGALQPAGLQIPWSQLQDWSRIYSSGVGIEDSFIKTFGRWQSTAILLYVRVPREKLASFSRQLSSVEGPGSSTTTDSFVTVHFITLCVVQ